MHMQRVGSEVRPSRCTHWIRKLPTATGSNRFAAITETIAKYQNAIRASARLLPSRPSNDKTLTEMIMKAIIDLSSELLVDRSRIQDPYLQLLLTATGKELANGSAWVVVDKKIASRYGIGIPFERTPLPSVAA